MHAKKKVKYVFNFLLYCQCMFYTQEEAEYLPCPCAMQYLALVGYNSQTTICVMYETSNRNFIISHIPLLCNLHSTRHIGVILATPIQCTVLAMCWLLATASKPFEFWKYVAEICYCLFFFIHILPEMRGIRLILAAQNVCKK